MNEPKLPSPPEGHQWAEVTADEYFRSDKPALAITIRSDRVRTYFYYVASPFTVNLIVKMRADAINPDSVATLRNAVGPACDLVAPLADAIEDRLPGDAS